MDELEKYTLGFVGDHEITTDDVQEWSDDVFEYAANVLHQQPDPYGMGVWKHLSFGSMFLPDIVHGTDIKPLKLLVRMICAVYEPGPDYGPTPTGDDFLRAGAEARAAYWQLTHLTQAQDDDAESTAELTFSDRWYSAAEIQTALKNVKRPSSASTVTAVIKTETANKRIDRQGKNGPMRVRSDLQAELKLDP